MGGLKEEITWNSLPLYLENGQKIKVWLQLFLALENKIVNISDVYLKNHKLWWNKNFDKSTGYRSKSMLVIPPLNHEANVIGVLQLINKTDTGRQDYFI